MRRLFRTKSPVLLVVLFSLVSFTGCGTPEAPVERPEVTFLSASCSPYGDPEARRLDFMADLSNPTSEALSGCFLELMLESGLRISLEFGDLAPREEETTWKPFSLLDPVEPGNLLGAPATVARPEGPGSLPETWFLTRIQAATLGYSVGGKKVERDLTEELSRALPVWAEAQKLRIEAWRSRPTPPP